MPFLAVCPDCHYSQVCVLPESVFPRIKCCRCREVYDPVGLEDTEIIPELAGPDLARLIRERRASHRGARKSRTRRRTKAGRARRKAVVAAPVAAPAPSLDDMAAAVLSVPVVAPVATDAAPPPAADTEPGAQQADTVPDPGAAPSPRPFPTRPRRRARSAAPVATPLTAGALALLGAALAAAAFEGVRFLFYPLALVSLLLGVWAVRVARREGVPSGYGVAMSVLAGSVVIASFFVPELLGFVTPQTPEWAENDVQVVPYPQFAGSPDVWKAEWVDATRASLQQGPTRIEVVEVRVGRIPNTGLDGLLVRVRRHRQAGFGGQQAAADSDSWNDAVRAVLVDRDGRRYEQLVVRHEPVGGADRRADPAEPEVRDTVLAFPAVATAAGLRLELPAVAWGGRGVFRFGLPASMVRR